MLPSSRTTAAVRVGLLIGGALALVGTASYARAQSDVRAALTCPAQPSAVVTAADPNAVQAGLDLLAQGGTAIDAAVAAKAVLTFVEAPETGIGGGGFLLHWRSADRSLTFFDGRETAPEAATPRRFLLPGGRSMPFSTAVVSGRAVGVPGMVSMLHLAHEQHGKLAWRDLFQPAITMAENGMPMPERLRQQLAGDPSLLIFRDTRRNLRSQRGADVLENADLADTLRRIADGGSEAFYRGEMAESIVAAATGRRLWPSDMTLEDLADYEAKIRDPVCGTYRQ
jgi:gamma-glutamyltranspeptidase/glutathione hydrolase